MVDRDAVTIIHVNDCTYRWRVQCGNGSKHWHTYDVEAVIYFGEWTWMIGETCSKMTGFYSPGISTRFGGYIQERNRYTGRAEKGTTFEGVRQLVYDAIDVLWHLVSD